MNKALAVFAAGLAFAAGHSVQAQPADTILVNGKILTVDSKFSVRQALAVPDGKIAALGTTAAIKKLAGPKTRFACTRSAAPGLLTTTANAARSNPASSPTSPCFQGLHDRAGRGDRGGDNDGSWEGCVRGNAKFSSEIVSINDIVIAPSNARLTDLRLGLHHVVPSVSMKEKSA